MTFLKFISNLPGANELTRTFVDREMLEHVNGQCDGHWNPGILPS